MSANPPARPLDAQLLPDRRRQLRRRIVETQFLPVQFTNDNAGVVVDVGDGGLGVQAVVALPVGELTHMQFLVENAPVPIRGHAEVRWAEPSGRLGLRFVDFSEDSVVHVRSWLENVLRQPASDVATPAEIMEGEAPALTPSNILPEPPPSPAAPPPQVFSPITQSALPGKTALGSAMSRLLASRAAALEAKLEEMLANLMMVISAEGAIVALRSGESMLCRASLGTAPPKGSLVPQNSGLAGLCLRTRQPVWSADTFSDVRVDREACRQMNVRSTILAPVMHSGTVLGIVAVFSSRPHAFTRTDTLALTRITPAIAALARRH